MVNLRDELTLQQNLQRPSYLPHFETTTETPMLPNQSPSKMLRLEGENLIAMPEFRPSDGTLNTPYGPQLQHAPQTHRIGHGRT